MLKREIQRGAVYSAKVSGRIVPVRVLCARSVWTRGSRTLCGPIERTVWDCVNELTGRGIVVRSAQRFRELLRAAPESS